MKIVYSILGTFNAGGMERVLTNKANYLAERGYTVTIITTDQKGRNPFFQLNPVIQSIDLSINYTENSTSNPLKKTINYIAKQKQHHKALEKELKRLQADIVISMFDNDASFMHKIQDGSKKVLEIHFSRFKRLQYGRKGLWKWIDIYRSKQDLQTVQQYDRFVVLTEEDKGYWGDDLQNILVIPNANSFSATEQASLDNKKVLAIGRFDYQKGFEDLIKAWKLLANTRPDWILNIYGQGPMKQHLTNLIESLKLKKVVFLKEPVKAIAPVYLDHSIFAMTSRYEGLPMVLLEAQSYGLPLTSYACKCGPRDIIQGNGILVPEGDIASMAQSLETLMEDEKLRKQMGNISTKNALKYTEEIVMKKWTSLFETLVQ